MVEVAFDAVEVVFAVVELAFVVVEVAFVVVEVALAVVEVAFAVVVVVLLVAGALVVTFDVLVEILVVVPVEEPADVPIETTVELKLPFEVEMLEVPDITVELAGMRLVPAWELVVAFVGVLLPVTAIVLVLLVEAIVVELVEPRRAVLLPVVLNMELVLLPEITVEFFALLTAVEVVADTFVVELLPVVAEVAAEVDKIVVVFGVRTVVPATVLVQ
jgi:hypothetical protein